MLHQTVIIATVTQMFPNLDFLKTMRGIKIVFEVAYEIHFLYQEYHISKRQRYQNCNCEF